MTHRGPCGGGFANKMKKNEFFKMQDKTGQILTEHSQGVTWITISNPSKKNALSHEMYGQLQTILKEQEHDKRVGCMILRGEGDVFSAGGDIGRMSTVFESTASLLTADEKISLMRDRTKVVELLNQMPMPTIAMISGVALGSAFALSLACDMRIGDETARMATGFLRAGLPGDYGVHYFLPRIIGVSKAKEMMLLGSAVNAKEALAMGLLNQVFESSALYDEVKAIAGKLANSPRLAMSRMKENFRDARHASLSDMLSLECKRHIECASSDEHKEAVKALIEKRRLK